MRLPELCTHRSEDWRQFADRLIRECQQSGEPLEKLRIIFVWLSTHVKYDDESLKPGCRKLQGCEKNISEEQRDAAMTAILQNGEAVCAGYAWMFKRMAEHVGVNEVRYVAGTTKMLKACKNELSDEVFSTHAWNVVIIPNHQPFMVDATWFQTDAGIALTNEFWKVKPFWFIHQFFPHEVANQCLQPSWTLQQFANAPNYWPAYFSLGVTLIDNDSHFAHYLLYPMKGDKLPLKFMVGEASPAREAMLQATHSKTVEELTNQGGSIWKTVCSPRLKTLNTGLADLSAPAVEYRLCAIEIDFAPPHDARFSRYRLRANDARGHFPIILEFLAKYTMNDESEDA